MCYNNDDLSKCYERDISHCDIVKKQLKTKYLHHRGYSNKIQNDNITIRQLMNKHDQFYFSLKQIF